MKVTDRTWPGFVTAIPKETRLFLCYGQDYGLVNERASELQQKLLEAGPTNPFRSSVLTYDVLKGDMTALAEALHAIPLGGGNKVVLLRDLPTTAAPAALLALLPDIPATSSLILTASELTPSHNLRKYCEAEAHSAAIPCYHDTAASTREIVQKTLTSFGKSMAPDAMQLFIDTVFGDRHRIRNEVEKLVWYAADHTRPISVEEVAAVICGGIESSTDVALHYYFAGDKQHALKALTLLASSQPNPIPVIRAILRYLQRLEQVQLLRAEGQSIDAAMGALKPPIFFKHVEQFKHAIAKWSLPKIHQAYRKFYQLEIDCKTRLSNQSWEGLKVLMFTGTV